MSPLRVTFVTHYAELYGANLSLLALIDPQGLAVGCLFAEDLRRSTARR